MTRAQLAVLVSLFALFSCGGGKQNLLQLGEPCAPTTAPGEASAECSTGLCVALDSASGFCSLQCSEQTRCPDGYSCEAAGAYGKICRSLNGCKEDQDCPSGHVCNVATARCYIKVSRGLCSPCQDNAQCPTGGACFHAIGSGEQFCTGPCGAADACALGFKCQEIPAGAGGALIKQCVPASQSCNAGKELCTSCRGDDECGGPFDLCVRNVVSGEQFCGRDCNPKKNVCPANAVGKDGGACVPEELTTANNPECPTAFSCTNIGQSDDPNVVGPFQCVPNSNTCQNYCSSSTEVGQLRQCGLGKTCTAAACAPATDGRECAPCSTNDDCRKGEHPENRCIVNDCPTCPFKGEAFCASPCADDNACLRSFGPGFVCKKVADSAGAMKSYCIPQRGTCASGLGRLGDDCTAKGAQDCVAGVCLVAGTTSLCSLACTKDTDCGDTRYRCCESMASGYDCSDDKRTLDGPKSGAGVCAPLGGLFGDDCTPGRPPCQTGTCLDLGTARVCTDACANGAACRAGFSCRKADLPASMPDAGVKQADVCFPEGGGKVGANCSFGPAACESGLCIRKDSGPICTVACTSAAECPTEWTCELTQAVTMQSIQSCIPPGLQ